MAMMVDGPVAANADAYVEALSGGQGERVMMFRGKRVTLLNPRIKPSGKYELAHLVATAATEVDPALVKWIAAEPAKLNAELGDPTREN